MPLSRSLLSIALVTTSAPIAHADYPAEVLADDPLVYYRFEEAAGATSLVDSSGNALDVGDFSLAGTTVFGEVGALGGAALFNGDGSFLTPLALDPSIGNFTIEALIRPTQTGADRVFISNGNGNTGPGRSNLLVNGGSQINSFIGGGTTASGTFTDTADVWYHVVLTYDQGAVAGGVDPTLRFFVNGEAGATSTRVAEAADGGWVLGSNKGQSGQYYAGLLDEVAIYDFRLDDPNGDGDTSDSRVGAHFKEFASENDVLLGFETDAEFLDAGGSAALSWSVSPALTALTIDDGTGPFDVLGDTVDCIGQQVVTPTTTTTYTLSGRSPVGTEDLRVTIAVDSPPVIDSFTANFAEVPEGGEIALSWQVTNATSVEIDNGVGAVDPVGGTSAPLVVNGDTTFTLTATNDDGNVTTQVTVTAVPASAAALVAHWTFDEGTGATAADSINSPDQDGTLTGGATWITGANPVGPAGAEFAATDDIVQTNSMGVTGVSARTVAMWIRAEAQVDNPGMTMLSYGGSNGSGSRYSVRLNNNAANGILGAVRLEVAGGYAVGTTPLIDSQWHHIAVTKEFDTDVQQTLIYVDGALEEITGSVDEPINSGGNQLLAIGGSNHAGNYNFTGGIDDVRIYDGVLSAGEIADLFEGESALPEITSVVRNADGSVTIGWSGSPGEYAIDYSFNLEPGEENWLELTDSAQIPSGMSSGSETDSSVAPIATETKLFYRVRIPE